MIKVGFSRSNGIVGTVIRWFTASEINHTFIIFPLAGREWVLEAGWFGIFIIPWERYVRHTNVTRIFEQPAAELDDISILRYIGDGYDYAGLFGMAWVMLGRGLKRRWRNPWQSARASFCSEMVAHLLLEAKVFPKGSVDPKTTSPQDLLVLLDGVNDWREGNQ